MAPSSRRQQNALRMVLLGVATLLLSLQLFLWSYLPPPPPPDVVSSSVESPRSKNNQVLNQKSVAVPRQENAPPVQPVTLAHGITVQPFHAWPTDRPLPCLGDQKGNGFFFMKLMKTGGSTAAGVHVRMLQHIARRLSSQETTTTTTSTTTTTCQGQWDHDWAYNMLADRQRNKSFTWTLVRDPTKRVVSQFFHFEVTRNGTKPTDANFQSYLWSEYTTRDALHQYYLRTLSVQRRKRKILTEDIPGVIQQILRDYDFIGITERMEETAVALLMLLDLRLADILYLDAKASGGYDEGGGDRKCHFIQPSSVSAGMAKYFGTSKWKRIVHPDVLLYEAANKALDLTIEQLGKEQFKKNLEMFRQAQSAARKTCLPRQVFPCTSKGELNPAKNCLWKDSGCGTDCLDEVATELHLW